MHGDLHDYSILGTTTRGFELAAPVTLSLDDRRRHFHLIGKTGTGKTTLLRSLIYDDLAAGRNFAVLDPLGGLAEDVIDAVPIARNDQVIYFNPADLERPIGFNPLFDVAPDMRHLVADHVVSAFMHIWGGSLEDTPRLVYVLYNGLRLLLDSPGSTLLGLPRLLVDDRYRERLLKRCVDPVVAAYWENEFAGYDAKFRAQVISPVQNKIGMLLSPPGLRLIIGQPRSTIDIARLMNEGGVLVANLAKGKIGATASHLLGAFLATTIAQVAEERTAIPFEHRRDFTLCCDEVQNFATESFAQTLSEARNWRLIFGLAIVPFFPVQRFTVEPSLIRSFACVAIFVSSYVLIERIATALAIAAEAKSAITDIIIGESPDVSGQLFKLRSTPLLSMLELIGIVMSVACTIVLSASAITYSLIAHLQLETPFGAVPPASQVLWYFIDEAFRGMTVSFFDAVGLTSPPRLHIDHALALTFVWGAGVWFYRLMVTGLTVQVLWLVFTYWRTKTDRRVLRRLEHEQLLEDYSAERRERERTQNRHAILKRQEENGGRLSKTAHKKFSKEIYWLYRQDEEYGLEADDYFAKSEIEAALLRHNEAVEAMKASGGFVEPAPLEPFLVVQAIRGWGRSFQEMTAQIPFSAASERSQILSPHGLQTWYEHESARRAKRA